MGRGVQVSLGLLAVAMTTAGCFGPFNLTRRLYQWNQQVGAKWEREFMFILLAWAPVYGVSVLADAVVFNSMEFWTGNNPVDPPGRNRSALPQIKRVARGDDEAYLTYRSVPGGASLLIEQFHHGHPAGSLTLEQHDGLTVGRDAHGHVLITAQALADGGLVLHDRKGHQLAAYSADQVDQVLHAAHQ